MAFITTMPAPPMSYMQSYLADLRSNKTEEFTVNTDDTLKKQYNYPGAFISHGEGEAGEKIPEVHIVKKKKYMWTSVVDFFKQKQKFGRRPFVFTPNI